MCKQGMDTLQGSNAVWTCEVLKCARFAKFLPFVSLRRRLPQWDIGETRNIMGVFLQSHKNCQQKQQELFTVIILNYAQVSEAKENLGRNSSTSFFVANIKYKSSLKLARFATTIVVIYQ